MALCVIAVVGVPPCQCLSFGGHQTTSPGRSSTLGWPSLCTQPKPEVTTRICPSGCLCHAVRAPGSNVTLAPRIRAGSGASNSGSIRTLPVKYSPGPFPDGWEPLCLMSIVFLSPTSLAVPSAPKSEDSGDHACRLYRQKRIAWLDELTNTPGRAHRSRRVRRSGG